MSAVACNKLQFSLQSFQHPFKYVNMLCNPTDFISEILHPVNKWIPKNSVLCQPGGVPLLCRSWCQVGTAESAQPCLTFGAKDSAM